MTGQRKREGRRGEREIEKEREREGEREGDSLPSFPVIGARRQLICSPGERTREEEEGDHRASNR